MSPQPRRHPVRRWRPAAVLVGLLATLIVGSAGVAHAAAYRYWNYYHLTNGAWTFSQKGIEAYTPADGSVEGFRFAVSTESGSTRLPRAVVPFEKVCAATPVQPGLKRVGVVLDFGRPEDAREGGIPPAPTARCAVVEANATAATVLAAVAPIRAEKGMLCAIDGYPAGGSCSDTVATVPAAAAAPDTPVAIAPVGATGPATAGPATNAPGSPATASGPAASTSANSSTSALTWVAILVVGAAIATAALLSVRRRRR